MADRARVFKNGRSQAVRIPRKYRFDGEEVRIWKEGSRVILEPVEQEEWPADFWQIFEKEKDEYFPIPEPLPSSPVDIEEHE
ncbi:MAG: antitoxin [Spirochaetaceae bacterium]